MAYAAPEQLMGLPCGPAVDVFSLGLLLWELVTGGRVSITVSVV